MTWPRKRVREKGQPQPPPPIEPAEEKRGYQPQRPMSPKALANPPRGGSHIRPPASPPKK